MTKHTKGPAASRAQALPNYSSQVYDQGTQHAMDAEVIEAIVLDIKALAALPLRRSIEFKIPDVGLLRLHFSGTGLIALDLSSSRSQGMLDLLHALHGAFGDNFVYLPHGGCRE